MLKILKNIVLQDRLTKIRNVKIDGIHFKAGLVEMGTLIGYEFASNMDIREVKVKTPLGIANGIKINDTENIVVVTVLRAAIPMVEGVMNVFDEAKYGMVGAWREKEPPFKVNVGYLKIPDINDKIVIIVDPMLATGNTMNLIIKELKKLGTPNRLAIFNVISTEEGVEKVLANHSEVEIYTCSIENKLKDGYIIPGMGDAGDIAFGKPIE
jgi:uracil phosphoribosyltransferase